MRCLKLTPQPECPCLPRFNLVNPPRRFDSLSGAVASGQDSLSSAIESLDDSKANRDDVAAAFEQHVTNDRCVAPFSASCFPLHTSLHHRPLPCFAR